MSTKYFPTIGLEIHAELKTASKMFCSCKNDPDEEKENKNICPICMSHPGTLPVLNIQAIKHVLKVGLAIDGKLADFTEWDRKNYFYPDIPKGYQISQFKYPLVSGGKISEVAVERIHLEEDTAQSTHDTHEKSLVNFNRAGVPLMELVTKPVIHDAATAVAFAKNLQMLLRYLGAGDANMEKGEMRVEANISVAPIMNLDGHSGNGNDRGNGNANGSSNGNRNEIGIDEKSVAEILDVDSKGIERIIDFSKLGTKTEVKNLNSFRTVERAIEYEIERQTSLLEEGGKVVQETRGWDDNISETYSQRSKESSHDYRYFPEPDIPKLKISEIDELATEKLKNELPELPWAKSARFKNDFGMTDKEAAVFIESTEVADYFDQVIVAFKDDKKKVKLTINYLLTDYLGALKKAASDSRNPKAQTTEKNFKEGLTEAKPLSELSNLNTIFAPAFSELIDLIADGKLSSRGAKDLLTIMVTEKFAETKTAENAAINTPNKSGYQKGFVLKLAEKNNLIQQSNTADLCPAIDKIIADNVSVVAEYKAGKTASLQFLIGQAMKATKGSANPEIVKKLLLEKL